LEQKQQKTFLLIWQQVQDIIPLRQSGIRAILC
jgi:hypothetical protein